MTSFAGGVRGIGAYATALLTTRYGVTVVALIVGVLTLVALVLGAVTMRLASGRSVARSRGPRAVLPVRQSRTARQVRRDQRDSGANLFGITLDSGRSLYFLIWAVVLAAIVSVQNLLNSRPGRAIRARRGVMAERWA